MKRILFVCSGNTCRSPLAEKIAKKVFSNSQQFKSRISSAGSSAVDGLPASSPAVRVAEENSLDLSNHHARLLSRELVKEADLIVVMGANHRETVGVIEPTALAYTYLLTDFCDDEDGDILDPMGMGIETYQKTYAVIEKCVKAMKEHLTSFDGWKKPTV